MKNKIEWVSVEDRLPETDDVVITAISLDKEHLFGYELSRCINGKRWTSEYANDYATHWCEIPDGPLPWKEFNPTSFPEGTKVKIVPKFKKEQIVIKRFVNDRVINKENKSVTTLQAYRDYRNWCCFSKEFCHSKKTFVQQMKNECEIKTGKDRFGRQLFVGIELKYKEK